MTRDRRVAPKEKGKVFLFRHDRKERIGVYHGKEYTVNGLEFDWFVDHKGRHYKVSALKQYRIPLLSDFFKLRGEYEDEELLKCKMKEEEAREKQLEKDKEQCLANQRKIDSDLRDIRLINQWIGSCVKAEDCGL